MTIRIGIRSALIVSAAGLLLAIGHTPAQVPPPAADVEQRLKALEDKMDRVLKLLEARDARPAERSPAATLEAARDKLRADLEAKQREYQDFQQKNPYAPLNLGDKAGARNIFAERLGKIETRRAELQIKMQEMQDQMARVEKAYDGGKNRQAALRMIAGVKVTDVQAADTTAQQERVIAQLNGARQKLVAAFGEKHESVKDADAAIALARKTFADAADAAAESEVKSHLKALREEIRRSADVVESLNNMFELEAAKAREVSVYQAREAQYRADLDRLRQLLADVEKQLRDAKGPPK